MRLHCPETKIRIGMSPAKEEVEHLNVHSTRLFEKKASIRFQHLHNFINYFSPFRDVMENTKDDNDILARVGELTQICRVLNEEGIPWIVPAGNLDLLFHHIQADITSRLQLIQQECAMSIATADFQHVFAADIQSEPLKQRQFNVCLAPPAPPGVHGAKFNIREFHIDLAYC